MIKYLKILSTIVILSLIVMMIDVAYANDNSYNNRINEISEAIKNAKLNNEKINYPRLYVERGKYYTLNKDYDNAMIDFNRVIKMGNVSKYWLGMAYYGRGVVYYSNRNHEKAIDNFSEAIKVYPRLYMAYAQKAVTYKEAKDYKHAINDINMSIDIVSKDNNIYNVDKARCYAIRAGIYEESSEYDKVIQDYTTAISLDSNNYLYYSLRGFVYYWNKKDYKKSIEDESKVIEILERNGEGGYNLESAYAHRAYLYKKQKLYGNAINDYSYAIKYCDKTSGENFFYIQYLISRGCLYAITNDNKKAINDFDLAENISDKVSLGRVYLSKALYYYSLGDNDSTIKYLQKSIKADKNSDKALKMYESIMKNETTGILTFEDLLSGI